MRSLFGLDDDWVRPRPAPGWWRFDIALAAGLFLLSALGMEMFLSGANIPSEFFHPRWQQYLALGSAALLLVLRRQLPVTIMLAATGLHFFVADVVLPETVIPLGSQILYFLAMFSAFAWAQNRRALLLGTGAILVLMSGWLVWQFSFSAAITQLTHTTGQGILPPQIAVVIWGSVVNFIYFFGAILGGQVTWNKAKADALVHEQAVQLAFQSSQIASQAVLTERLRIARELHDVVAHHVSLIGIQAAAARRMLGSRPEVASEALSHVEQSSRDAVAEMRLLLRSLRTDGREEERGPVPDLAQLPELISTIADAGFRVDYDIVDPSNRISELSSATSTTLYRVIQEALSNVRRHSTAQHARVVVRINDNDAEAEITDHGLPRRGSAGSGFGHQGIRERVAALGGVAEMETRSPRGYRVRVLLPIRVNR